MALAAEAPLPAVLPAPRSAVRLGGHIGLVVLFVAAFAIVAMAAAGPSVLLATTVKAIPGWMAGPVHGLFGRLALGHRAVQFGFSAVLAAMALAYAAVLVAARHLSTRVVVAGLVLVHATLLLSPPLALSDVFNYLGYARLGALHHVNPYAYTLAAQPHDPVFRLATWHEWRSPYGPLFTTLTYPLGWLPLPVAYWVLKVATVVVSLAFLAVLWRCARQLGRDPRWVVLMVAANPIYIVYAIGGFHNDFFMLLLSTAAIALLLARHERAAGAALVLAVGVKFTVVLLLPFLLLAAATRERRLRVLSGAVLAGIPLAAVTVGLFGASLPNVSGQSALVTNFSVPNLIGLALGAGGATPLVFHAAEVAVLLLVVHQVLRARDWVAGAGWAALALVASLAWLMPWYVLWALPLVALSTSPRLRRAGLAMLAFVLITFIPATGILFSSMRIEPPITKAGREALLAQQAR